MPIATCSHFLTASRRFLVIGAVLVTPCSAAAQAPPAIRSLEALRDSLARVGDVRVLEARRDLIRRLREENGDEPMLHLREGVVEWRLAYLGDWGRSRDAEKAFDRAAVLRPTWTYPRFGHGLAKVAQADWQQDNDLNLGTRVGVGALQRALEAFVEAVSRDPGFAAAQTALAETALRLRTPEDLRTALAVIDSIGNVSTPDVELLRGRLERRVGDPDSAVAAFGRYLVESGDSGLAHLELARTRLEMEVGEGGIEDYFVGAQFDDSAAVQGYRADIALIADEEELSRYDSVAGDARVAFLQRFWARRDRADLRGAGERLAEHYRRLGYVQRHFWLDVTRRHYWLGDLYESGIERFDDRGVVYLRQGPPTQRVTPLLYGATGNESWRYRRPDGDLILHFCAEGDLRDYRLVASALDIMGGRCNTGGVQVDQLLTSRQELSPIYSKLGAWGPFGRAKMAALERNIGEASAEVSTTTDRFVLNYDREINAVVRPLAVGLAGGKTLLHLVLAVGGWDSVPPPASGEVNLRIRFGAFDGDGNSVAALDTTVVRVVTGPTGGAFLLDRVSLPVPPGLWTYRLAVERDDSTGTLFPTDSLSIPDFRGGTPRVSDLMIGTTTVPLVWNPTPRDTAYLDPRQRFHRDEELELYYEVYGLVPGAPYETTLELSGQKKGGVFGLFQGEAPQLSFHFSETARADIARSRRTITLADLNPGTYQLVVTVLGPDGGEGRRETAIEVVP